MASLFRLSLLKHLPTPIFIMLLGTLLTRAAYFMVWPFLAMILYQQFNMSATGIGGLLALSSILGSVTGIYTGYLSDIFCRRTIMLIGVVISIISFIMMSFSSSPILYLIAISGISIGRALLEACSKALIGDYIDSPKERESIQYYRYYLVNVGAAIGPYIGLASGLSAQRETFLITAIVYFIYGIMLRVFLLSSKKEEKIKKVSNDISFAKTLSIIISHRTFVMLLLCNVLVMFVYANFDSTLVQYLSRSNINNVTNFIALLVIVNSLTIITLQIPTLVLLRNFTPRIKILIGIMLIAIAQIIFAFSPINTVYYLCVATVILSFGEIIAIPTFNVEVDRLTPHHLRGAFFGASNMSSIGSALAPIYGGIMLDLFNATLLFSLLSLTSLITLLIYYIFLIKKNN
ncbi:MFS transporter [Photorhabdus luminescens]|uniref:MFS transporter n=1 Tax=Photorhabdus luminescens subsp. sonorensis TaxID=1173677 RepID=A0A5C4RMT3_PHOLU|nr:MFS transporter [Photorhabdus luminescens]TNH45064.1 MFS transporter [Photorhabdus luminescens subsp. sonorensis]